MDRSFAKTTGRVKHPFQGLLASLGPYHIRVRQKGMACKIGNSSVAPKAGVSADDNPFSGCPGHLMVPLAKMLNSPQASPTVAKSGLRAYYLADTHPLTSRPCVADTQSFRGSTAV